MGWTDYTGKSQFCCSLYTENYYTAAIMIAGHNIHVATDSYRCTKEKPGILISPVLNGINSFCRNQKYIIGGCTKNKRVDLKKKKKNTGAETHMDIIFGEDSTEYA